jgi:hypothetical protein
MPDVEVVVFMAGIGKGRKIACKPTISVEKVPTIASLKEDIAQNISYPLAFTAAQISRLGKRSGNSVADFASDSALQAHVTDAAKRKIAVPIAIFVEEVSPADENHEKPAKKAKPAAASTVRKPFTPLPGLHGSPANWTDRRTQIDEIAVKIRQERAQLSMPNLFTPTAYYAWAMEIAAGTHTSYLIPPKNNGLFAVSSPVHAQSQVSLDAAFKKAAEEAAPVNEVTLDCEIGTALTAAELAEQYHALAAYERIKTEDCVSSPRAPPIVNLQELREARLKFFEKKGDHPQTPSAISKTNAEAAPPITPAQVDLLFCGNCGFSAGKPQKFCRRCGSPQED